MSGFKSGMLNVERVATVHVVIIEAVLVPAVVDGLHLANEDVQEGARK